MTAFMLALSLPAVLALVICRVRWPGQPEAFTGTWVLGAAAGTVIDLLPPPWWPAVAGSAASLVVAVLFDWQPPRRRDDPRTMRQFWIAGR